MSKEKFIKFYTENVEPDSKLKQQLANAQSEKDFMALLEPLAKKTGYDISIDDVAATVIGELSVAIHDIKKDGSLRLKEGKFFNPLASRIFSIGADMQMGTCHC